MNVQRNSVVRVNRLGSLEPGLYRILEIYTHSMQLCLFSLDDSKNVAKPVLISFEHFQESFKSGNLEEIPDTLPAEIYVEDEDLSTADREHRDLAYTRIEALVSDEQFLYVYAMTGRSSVVVNHAKSQNVRPLVLYRCLRKYWKYGQVRNSLLRFTKNCGGRGKEKSASSRQRGRPIDSGKYNLRERKSINIGPVEKGQILESVRKEMKKGNKFSYSRAYDSFKKSYCFEEIQYAVANNRPAQIASEEQFRYWAKKLVPKEDILRETLSESEFEKDHKGYLSSVSARVTAPGTRYEIDSTIADVFIVSEYNRQIIIGRPTVYAVVDTASRMIAGIHISPDPASWRSARQAIYNAVMPKSGYCKRYRIDIEDHDWPCFGLPTRFLCDRGEMLGEKAERLAESLGTCIEIAPPYRGDAKSIVERRFGILNEEIHFLPGTTLGEMRKRGYRDPRLDAALTINAFTEIILELVLEHNTIRQFKDLVTPELVESNLSPTPLNYWVHYTSKMQHGLKKVSRNLFVAKLMNKGLASSTEKGIVYKGLRYTCDLAEQGEWATKALNNGSWKMECRSDESWSDIIFIRPDHTSDYIECRLCDSERTYRGKHSADIIYVKEWTRFKREKADHDLSKVNRSIKAETIIRLEVEATKKATKDMSKNSRMKGIRENRRAYLQEEKERDRQQEVEVNDRTPQEQRNSENRCRLLDLMRTVADEER